MTGDDKGVQTPGSGADAGIHGTEQGAMSGAQEASAAPPTGRSRDPTVFVLLRELSEVHLLLDNISANPTTTVAEPQPVPLPVELGDKWIERVCEISWPPDGSTEEKAEDAALLIRAKDYLNRLSHPASGSTIAFTTLVTQGDAERKKLEAQGDEVGTRPPTRSSLAQAAYPDLVAKATGFRRWMAVISVGLLAVLLLTCVLSWYVAYGNSALSEFATAQARETEAIALVNQAESGESAPRAADTAPPPAPAGGRSDSTGATLAPAPAPVAVVAKEPFRPYCDRRPYTSPTQSQLCEARWRSYAAVERVQRRLVDWLCWGPFGRCEAAETPAAEPVPPSPYTKEGRAADETAAKAGDARAAARLSAERARSAAAARAAEANRKTKEDLQNAPSRAAALANIMGSAVLPFLYGLLGAGAAIIRSLSRKIRASLLSPRDLHLSIQQLALGAVVGACIGLFIVAPGDAEAGESLFGPVTLSASAVSFVAGFGVEAVFQALEALIARIFNIAPVATANRGDGVASA